MSIKSMLKRLSGAPQADEPAKPDALAVLTAPKGVPGTRVHHEYMVEPTDTGFHWLARVYAMNGAVNEKEDVAPNESAACEAALAWCATTTAALKGI